MIIREANINDAFSIAKVHIDTWRTTYKGIVPDEYLNKMDYDQRGKKWQSIISDASKVGKYIFVAEDEVAGIVGFASCGLDRDGDELYKGELYAIYIFKEYQNKGIGRMLLNRVVNKFIELKINSMIIWALENNYTACRFYEANGGKSVKEKYITIGNDTLKEVAYGWLNIDSNKKWEVSMFVITKLIGEYIE